jgi:hypothetical protein
MESNQTKCFKMLLFLDKKCAGPVTGDRKIQVLAALFSLAVEHQSSIITLFGKGNGGSAFALVRPLTETVYRAFWGYFCADTAQYAKILADNRRAYPGFEDMGKEINRKLTDTNAFGDFFTTHAQAFSALSSYTHSGMMQIGRRFDSVGNLRGTFSQDDIDSALTGTINLLTVFAVQFLRETDRHSISEEIICYFNDILHGKSPESNSYEATASPVACPALGRDEHSIAGNAQYAIAAE